MEHMEGIMIVDTAILKTKLKELKTLKFNLKQQLGPLLTQIQALDLEIMDLEEELVTANIRNNEFLKNRKQETIMTLAHKVLSPEQYTALMNAYYLHVQTLKE